MTELNHSTNQMDYYQQADGVHVAILHKGSRQTADEFGSVWARILDDADPDEPIKLLVDMRADGPPPFNHFAPLIQQINRDHMKHGQLVRSAYLFGPGSAMLTIVKSFLEMTRTRARRKFYQGDHFDEAVRWLHEGTHATRPDALTNNRNPRP